jgi:hypothetical protein
MTNNEKQLFKYVSNQIQSVTMHDEKEGKRGAALQQAKSHKEGYIEALNNILAVMQQNIK